MFEKMVCPRCGVSKFELWKSPGGVQALCTVCGWFWYQDELVLEPPFKPSPTGDNERSV